MLYGLIFVIAYYKRKSKLSKLHRMKHQIIINNSVVILIIVGQFEQGSKPATECDKSKEFGSLIVVISSQKTYLYHAMLVWNMQESLEMEIS